MKVFYIADFFVEDITGGAEICDDVLLSLFKERGHKVVRFRSAEVTPRHLSLYQKLGFHVLVSNFVRMQLPTVEYLIRSPGSYSIMEHDHKYIRHRDPSKYKGFIVPKQEIVNELLYANAKNVFAQSKIHAEVISINLNREVINLGMSLWSDEQLKTVEKYIESEKQPTHAIMDSPNPTKNTYRNINFCETKKLPYTKIGPSSYEDFIRQLSECEKFVFFPAVLETFNRVLVEAKMLGCKVITNHFNGCISEDWFKGLEGQELIDFVRKERSSVVDKVITAITTAPPRAEPEDITVILNAYRRPYNLKMQIEAIRAQTNPPKNLWLWVNAHEDNEGFDFESLDVDRVFKNDYNWKFYGRFAAALLADTEYVAIYDDDTIPGKQWHFNCLETMKTHQGILGSAGVILNGDRYVQHDRCGWPTQNAEITEVDLVGHAWFFKREWLRYLWQEKPTTWDNGEDIQFAFMSKIYGGVKTYCPPHPPDNKEMHGSILGNELGIDSKATSNNQDTSHEQFFSERDVCVRAGLVRGWDTVREVKLS